MRGSTPSAPLQNIPAALTAPPQLQNSYAARERERKKKKKSREKTGTGSGRTSVKYEIAVSSGSPSRFSSRMFRRGERDGAW